jgi:FtsP/CotA-like multicopper oxidase with cupredoxin domain
MNRRQFLKLSAAAGASVLVPLRGISLQNGPGGVRPVFAAPAAAGLSDPALQPKFVNTVPDALAPGFIYQPDDKGVYKIKIGQAIQQTGLIDPATQTPLSTPIWGYGDQNDKIITWPGRTFQVTSGPDETQVVWANALDGVGQHLLPVDTNLHWCYSLHGYTKYSIAKNGVPIITHLHGGHTDFQFDGNPEFFYGPDGKGKQVVGPQWANVPGGFTTKFRYDNNVPAGNLWYHDHALGITRLNVYAGMAGFYFVRDGQDTGQHPNTLTLPAWPYEKAYAIQDRMFLATGELFYPAFPGDPFYHDFITGEGAVLPPDLFPGGGPTALAEFFGDHMVVNGWIWPKENVEPRNHRMHLLNGTDSRFMAIRFRIAASPTSTDLVGASTPIPFYVIGSDQGLASSATMTDTLLSEPGSRYDIVFDFSTVPFGSRVIMENIGGDEPFGGDIPGPQVFSETNRIMAFDVTLNLNDATTAAGLPDQADNFNPANISNPSIPNTNPVDRTRKVALFEGLDEFGRLQPLLGTAEPATDHLDNPVNWPATPDYVNAGLTGQMEGSMAWHSPTTENPALGDTEIWEIYNATGDAHPVHLHLVHFDVLGRQEFTADVINQPVVQHNGALGNGFRLENIALGNVVPQPGGYVENAPKDMVTALPDQVTRIKATFDKPGRYVWHCHILSHEDHEMMRVLHVGPGA